MTPTQLDHLRLIDAHLERLLNIAAKRTPGEWGIERTMDTNWIGPMRKNGDGKISIIVCDTDRDRLKAECIQQNDADATFIASCAGNAEAGWKATRAVIQTLLDCNPAAHTGSPSSLLLDSILAAFPLELIQKP